MANITINAIPTRVQYEAAAGQTVFSYTFPIKENSDLKVYKRTFASTPDNETDLLILTDDYTVSGANTAAGGTIELNVAAAVTDVVTIVGDKPIDRTAIYDQSVTLSKEDLNNDFNDNVMFDKQIETLQDNITPKYNRSELIQSGLNGAPAVREDNLKLPILNDGEFWVGRGDRGDTPDDIWKRNVSEFTGGGGGSGGEGSVETTITQPGHGLSTGDWLKFTTGTDLYEQAQANNATNGDVVGLCKEAINVNSFVFQQVGLNNSSFTGLTTGNYFLSTTVAGAMSLAAALNDDEVSVPVFIADTATTGWVRNFRGKVIGDNATSPDTGNGKNRVTVTQVAHGFVVEDALYVSATNTYAKAIGTSFVTSQVAGLVVEVVDVDTFIIQSEGWTTEFAGKTGAALYWLSDATAGLITVTKPTLSSSFTRPCFVAVNATNGWILENRQHELNDDANTQDITEIGHSFTVGQFVKPSAVTGVYEYAKADTKANATGALMVIDVPDANSFTVQQTGLFTDGTGAVAGLTEGSTYYLSESSATGGYTLTEPTAIGEATKPVFVAITATSLWLLNDRPLELPVGGTASGSWDLLASLTMTGQATTTTTFTTIFEDNAYDFYQVKFIDMYSDTDQTALYATYYIGGAAQNVSYESQSIPNDGILGLAAFPTAIQLSMLEGGVRGVLRNTLLTASSGEHEFFAPRTNGTYKLSSGDSSFTVAAVGTALANMITNNTSFQGSTSPIQGIQLHAGGVRTLFGTVKVYGRN